MSDFILILIGAIGAFCLLLSIIYSIAFVRTKDKNAGYISIALMIACIISIFYLAFRL